MQEFIITTPDQLRTVISEIVKTELINHFQTASITEPIKDMENDLITRKEAAKLLGVSLPTLNEWSKSGTVTGYRLGSRVRYKRSELLANSLLQMKTSKTNKAA